MLRVKTAVQSGSLEGSSVSPQILPYKISRADEKVLVTQTSTTDAKLHISQLFPLDIKQALVIEGPISSLFDRTSFTRTLSGDASHKEPRLCPAALRTFHDHRAARLWSLVSELQSWLTQRALRMSQKVRAYHPRPLVSLHERRRLWQTPCPIRNTWGEMLTEHCNRPNRIQL